MVELHILWKVLDYSFIENKVYVPQVECVMDEIKQMFYHLRNPSSRHEQILISVDLEGIIWRFLNFRYFTLNLNRM